jgi:hypothetical protein
MWLCHYLCLSLRWLTGGVADGARHDIPVLAFPRANEPVGWFMPDPAGPAGPGPRQANPPGKEKGPGSAFGPESSPLATSSVSVVYWVPGPFPRPTPVQPDEPVGPANEPVAGLCSNLPPIAAMSTAPAPASSAPPGGL